MTKNSSEKIRISASVLCRLEDDNAFALLRNKNAYARGEEVFSPIGGAMEATDLGRLALMRAFGVAEDDFENAHDLRFMLPEREVGRFAVWLAQRNERHRETTPQRELAEELCDEAGLLAPQDVRGARHAPLGYYTERAVSKRDGTARPTVRIAEVYGTALPGDAMNR